MPSESNELYPTLPSFVAPMVFTCACPSRASPQRPKRNPLTRPPAQVNSGPRNRVSCLVKWDYYLDNCTFHPVMFSLQPPFDG